MLRVYCRDHAVARQLAAQLRAGGGPQHDLSRTRIEPGAGHVQRANPAADAARPAPHHRLNQLGVGALPESGVEIHDGDLTHDGELLETLERVPTIEHELSSVPQLHGATLHDVDAGHDHGRTGMPRAAAYALIPPTVSSPSWSTDAASTASAPASNASTTCVRVPIPPEAITGTRTALTTARNNSRSWPLRVPSASQLVSKISPAPRRSPSLAQPTASRAPAERPPTTSAPHCRSRRRASMASTTHCRPNASESSLRSCGRRTEAVLTLTLSAPAPSRRRASSTLRTPPPTVSGIRIAARTRRTVSTCVSRPAGAAATSSMTISSAPCAS